MLGISVFKDALWAEHLLVALAEELDFFVFVRVAILYAATFFSSSGSAWRGIGGHLGNRESGQNCIVNRQVICAGVMSDFVERAFNDGMLVDLTEAF